MKDNKRSFTILIIKGRKRIKSKKGGRYIARSAMDAAKKAFMRECRETKIKGQCTFQIVIQETTAGSKKNIYTYKMKRTKLVKPIIVKRGDNEIKIRYKVKGQLLKKE